MSGVAGCASTSTATPTSTSTARPTSTPTSGWRARVDALEVAKLYDACDRAPDVAEIAAPADDARPRELDVAVYTAHPDDEAMYAGATLTALASHGRHVRLTVNSHGEGGRLLVDGVERRDFDWQHVTAVRDPEMAEAARRMGIELAYLHAASEHADFGWTTSCKESLEHWNANLAGGLHAIVATLVDDMARRRPRVVLTLDPRDDPQASHHGHHKAVGVLVDAAARIAVADAGAGVEELVTMAPADAPPETVLVVPADPHVRRHVLEAHASQFWPKDLDGFGMRPDERFVVRWRASTARGATPFATMTKEAAQPSPR